MDLSQSILAKSDQLNADDLLSGPRTLTVAEVRRGNDEQPVSIVMAEFPADRPFKPSKTVIRLLAYAWGKETDDWPKNPRMTLYRDDKVKWAGQEIGGIRVSHLSHINKRLQVALAESKGKKSLHTVDPLPDDAPTSPAVSADTLAKLTETFTRKGIPEDKWLAGINHYTGGAATALEVVTEEQARKMLAQLATRPDIEAPDPATTDDPTLDPNWGQQA